MLPTVPLAVRELVITGATGVVPALFRGAGAPVLKSAELLPVSVAPPPARKIAVLVDGDGAAVPSAALAVPKPTKSCKPALANGDDPESGDERSDRATLPDVALMLIEPDASTAGSGRPLGPEPRPTRK